MENTEIEAMFKPFISKIQDHLNETYCLDFIPNILPFSYQDNDVERILLFEIYDHEIGSMEMKLVEFCLVTIDKVFDSVDIQYLRSQLFSQVLKARFTGKLINNEMINTKEITHVS